MDPDIQRLEERIAHLTRAVDDLSDIVRDQADRLDRAERAIIALAEATRDQSDPMSPPPADTRPPHW